MTGFQSGTADRRPTKDRSSDGVEPGHTPRPRVGRRVRMLLSFQRPSHLSGKGIPSPGASRTDPIPERTDEYSARAAPLGGLEALAALSHRSASSGVPGSPAPGHRFLGTDSGRPPAAGGHTRQ